MSISLKIKGNKHSNEGIGIDHVAIGDQAFHVFDRQYHPVTPADDIIVIRHYADKSVYTINTTNVASVDGGRNGNLIIAVAVPRGERVSGLFNLLLELSNFYKANYMTYDGARHHFTERKEVSAEFEAIIQSHTVDRYPYRPVVSDPDPDKIAYIYMPPADIAQLLDDPMRAEFAQFGQIVLVPKGNPADSMIKITPRFDRPYKITVNGREVSATVSDPEKVLNISVPGTKTLQPATVRFTLAEARSGNVNGASVIVDDFNQTLTVNVHQKPIAVEPAIKPIDKGTKRTTRKNHSKTSMIVAIIAAIVVVGVACWVLGLFATKESQPETEPLTQNETELKQKEAFEQEVVDEMESSAEGTEDAADAADISAIIGQEPEAPAVEPKANEPKANEPKADTTPKQSSEVKAAYDNYERKLTMREGITRRELNEVRIFVERNTDLTQTQKDRLSVLISTHNQIASAFSQLKSNGVKAGRDALSAISTREQGIKTYLGSILKLTDEDLENLALEFVRKGENASLYGR